MIDAKMTGYGRGALQENAAAYEVNIQAACGLMSVTGTDESGSIRVGIAVTTALYHREQAGNGGFIDAHASKADVNHKLPRNPGIFRMRDS